jgi:hypothetical protein
MLRLVNPATKTPAASAALANAWSYLDVPNCRVQATSLGLRTSPQWTSAMRQFCTSWSRRSCCHVFQKSECIE